MKQIFIIFLMLFSLVTKADTLSEFIETIPNQELTTYWGKDNAHKTVTNEQVTKIVRTAFARAISDNINPTLILAVIKVETNFRSNATSSEGAKGVMQVLPRFHKDKIKGRNIKDIDVSIEVGTQILQACLFKHNHNLSKALNCYSGGGGKKYYTKVMKAKESVTAFIKTNTESLLAFNYLD